MGTTSHEPYVPSEKNDAEPYSKIGAIKLPIHNLGSAAQGLDMMPLHKSVASHIPSVRPDAAQIALQEELKKHNEAVEAKRIEKQLSKQRRRFLGSGQ